MVTSGASVDGGSRKSGVPTGSARSWSDRMGTVGIDETAGAVALTTVAGGRGREARDGVIASRTDSLGAPLGPEVIINSKRRDPSGSGCSSVRPSKYSD